MTKRTNIRLRALAVLLLPLCLVLSLYAAAAPSCLCAARTVADACPAVPAMVLNGGFLIGGAQLCPQPFVFRWLDANAACGTRLLPCVPACPTCNGAPSAPCEVLRLLVAKRIPLPAAALISLQICHIPGRPARETPCVFRSCPLAPPGFIRTTVLRI